MLNQQHKLYINELVNLCMSQAANILSDMLHQKVALSIPYVEFVTGQGIQNLRENPNFSFLFSTGIILSSTIKFSSDFMGKASFMFPARHAKNLVQLCMLDSNEYDNRMEYQELGYDHQLIDADYDVLREVSNVMLNLLVGEFANFLEMPVEYTFPRVDLIQALESDQSLFLRKDTFVLIFHTALTLEQSEIKGTILMTVGISSIKHIINKIDQTLGDKNE